MHLIARMNANPLPSADARAAHPRPVADPQLVLQPTRFRGQRTAGTATEGSRRDQEGQATQLAASRAAMTAFGIRPRSRT
jgi:hypothetical protein